MLVEENSSEGMPSDINNFGLSVQTLEQSTFKEKTKQIKQILSKNRQERERAIH
jgi:hypothetical protein